MPLPAYNNLGEEREDIHITPHDLIDVGKDFGRGIHHCLSSKHIPKHWFPPVKRAISSNKKQLQKQLTMAPSEKVQAPTDLKQGAYASQTKSVDLKKGSNYQKRSQKGVTQFQNFGDFITTS